MSLYLFIDCLERATLRVAYRLRNLQEKLARYRNHLIFLIKCRNFDVVPNGLRIKLPIHWTKAKHIAERASKMLLRERVSFTRTKKVSIGKDIITAKQTLRSLTDESTFTLAKVWAETRASQVFQDTKDKHKKKFEQLTCRRRPFTTGMDEEESSRVVINLSKQEISVTEEQVLSLSMNFAPTPKEIPSWTT